MFPNLALDKLLKGLSRAGKLGDLSTGVGSPRDPQSGGGGGSCFMDPARRTRELAEAVTYLPLEQLTPLLHVIVNKHKRLVMDDKQVSMYVLRDFLALSHQRKNTAIDELEREIGCIDADMEWVEKQVAALGGSAALEAFAAEASAQLAAGGCVTAGDGATHNLHDAGGRGGRDAVGHGQLTDGDANGHRAAVEWGEAGSDVAAAGPGGGGRGGGRGRDAQGKGVAAERDKDSHSARSANAAASMVCEMLSTWGIDGGGAGAPVLCRTNSEPDMGKVHLAARGGGAGGGPGSKRTSIEMMRGTGPHTSEGVHAGHANGVNGGGDGRGGGGGKVGGAGVASGGHFLRRCPLGFGSGGQMSAKSRSFHTSSKAQAQGQAQGQASVRAHSDKSSRGSAASGRGSSPEMTNGGFVRPTSAGSTDSGSPPGSGSDIVPANGSAQHPRVENDFPARQEDEEGEHIEALRLCLADCLSEKKRRRIVNHFANLQHLYSKIRCGIDRTAALNPNNSLGGCGDDDDGGRDGKSRRRVPGATRATTHGTGRSGAAARRGGDFESFSKLVQGFTRYDRLRVVGELQHSDPLNASPSSSIVSSIEFDMNNEIFATAGVSKRIQFFNFRDVCEAGGDYSARAGHKTLSHGGTPAPPPPPQQRHSISTRSKLSCLSYSKHMRHHIASSDYEGVVTVWDVETKAAVVEFEEHDKRAWTVDYCRTDHRLLASGSDDGRVKIWSTAQEGSVMELDVRANVCCAQYGPTSAHQLAVGCADHRVHLFDLRNPSEALAVLEGHRKAVSYVRFLSSGEELVSASTDSSLCVWDIRGGVIAAAKRGAGGGAAAGPRPAGVLEGHTNEKNFVGLSVGAGDLIACGSETNEVFVYDKSFTSPLVTYNFGEKPSSSVSSASPLSASVVARWPDGAGADAAVGAAAAAGARGRPGAGAGAATSAALNQFVSATCWRGDDPILLAANSLGSIKVLQLVE